MVVIALMAPFLALARYPFAFGFATTIGLFGSFVTWSARRRKYDRIVWLICAYPLFPWTLLHLLWILPRHKLIARSSLGLLDGMFAFSDIGVLLGLGAYLATLVLLVSGAFGKADQESDQPFRKAARGLLFLMPPIWLALLTLTIVDPFGALASLFH